MSSLGGVMVLRGVGEAAGWRRGEACRGEARKDDWKVVRDWGLSCSEAERRQRGGGVDGERKGVVWVELFVSVVSVSVSVSVSMSVSVSVRPCLRGFDSMLRCLNLEH